MQVSKANTLYFVGLLHMISERNTREAKASFRKIKLCDFVWKFDKCVVKFLCLTGLQPDREIC